MDKSELDFIQEHSNSDYGLLIEMNIYSDRYKFIWQMKKNAPEFKEFYIADFVSYCIDYNNNKNSNE